MSEDETTLKGIEATGDPSEILDLSNFGFRTIKDNAFQNVSYIKILNLSYNSLYSLSEDTFSGLRNLENLDLSHNNIYSIKRSFRRLRNLRFLDLSYNRITELRAGLISGLNESCVILLEYNDICTMSSNIIKVEKLE